MKTGIIYYSFEGNCALVAQTIGAALQADVFEIKTTGGNKQGSGFAKFMRGMILMLKKPALLPLPMDIDAYDLIILGTPVWAGSPSSPIVSFLNNRKITGKKIALFCCHAGGMGKALEKFRALLEGNTIAGEIDFNSPAKRNSGLLKHKIGEWVKTLV